MVNEGGRPGGNSVKIPVKDMAVQMLDKMFPHLTPAQVTAIKAGTPLPPSPDWIEPSTGRRYDVSAVEREHQLYAELPLVTCVLAYGRQDPRHVKMARTAVEQFVRQSYPRKQLVVVNASGVPVTTRPWYEIKEVTVPPASVAALRNVGLDLAEGDWVMPCWDDDDYYDPHLLAYLVLHRRPGHAVLLKTQARVDLTVHGAYKYQDARGVANTMLVPRDAQARFRETEAEDVFFLDEHYPFDRVVVDNARGPACLASVAVYHGHNLRSADAFWSGCLGPHGWGLDAEESERLRMALAVFGLRLTPGGTAAQPT